MRKALASVLAINLAIMMASPMMSFADEADIPAADAAGSEAASTNPDEGDQPPAADTGDAEGPDVAAPPASPPPGPAPSDSYESAYEPGSTAGQTAPKGDGTGPAEGISIMPLSLGGPSVSGAAATVSDWEDLVDVLNNYPDVTTIYLANDIPRLSTLSAAAYDLIVDRTLTIDGQGNTLDFGGDPTSSSSARPGFKLTEDAPDSIFTLTNTYIKRTSADHPLSYLISSGAHPWAVSFLYSFDLYYPQYGMSFPRTEMITAPIDTTDGQNWTVCLEDVEGVGTQTGGLVSNVSGSLEVTGKLVWDATFNNPDDDTMVNVREQVYDGAKATLTGDTSHLVQAHVRNGANSTQCKVEFINNAEINFDNTKHKAAANTQALFIGALVHVPGSFAPVEGINVQADLLVDNSKLALRSEGKGTNNLYNSTLAIGGIKGGTIVRNGASVQALSMGKDANGSHAFTQQIEGGTFSLDGDGTEMIVENHGTSGNNGPTMFFAVADSQVCSVTNKAFLRVHRHLADLSGVPAEEAGNPNSGNPDSAALRLGRGSNNTFDIKSGGRVIIHNDGSNRPVATTAITTKSSAALEFGGDNFTFDIAGSGSAIELYSEKGAALAAVGTSDLGTPGWNDGTITVGPEAFIIAHGNVDPVDGNGAFGMHEGLTFEITEPLYYSFANTNESEGALAFQNKESGSKFVSTYSDVAVWSNGTTFSSDNNQVDEDPYLHWSLIDYALEGENFNTLVDHPTYGDTYYQTPDSLNGMTFDEAMVDGMQSFRRISGNNAGPTLYELLEATNADLYLRALGQVPEGLDGMRYIWTDEAYAIFDITRDGTTFQSEIGQTQSFRHSGSNNSEDLIYTVETDAGSFEGVVRYNNPEGFLYAGDTYQVAKAWRGDEDPDDANWHGKFAKPEDILSTPVTVLDTLPPVPAEISSHGGDMGALSPGLETTVSGTWKAGAAQAAPGPLPEAGPHNPEPAVKLYAVLEDGTELGEGTLLADGTWSYTLTEAVMGTLSEGDKVSFVLEDKNANKNPLAPTPNHDVMMSRAPYLVVTDAPLTLTHTDKWIGVLEAQEIADLGTNDPAQLAYLKDLIEAKANWADTPPSPEPAVEVSDVDPDWGPRSEYNLPGFKAANPDGKEYFLTYGIEYAPDQYIDRDDGKVTVLPYEKATPYIGANDFSISANNATDIMDMPLAERDAKLIELAGAEGRLSTDDKMSPDNVEVYAVEMTSPVDAGDYDLTFHVKGAPDEPDYYVTITVHVYDGDLPIITLTSPINVWIGDPAKKPAGAIDPPAAADRAFFMEDVQALSAENGDDITDDVTYTGDNAVNFNKVGMYPVTYTVTNSDGNPSSATRVYIVNDGSYLIDDDGTDTYVLHAQSFVVNEADADADTILADARAEAWKIDQASSSGTTPATAMVAENAEGYGKGCDTGEYPLTIAVAESPAITQDITATVIDDEYKLTDGTDPDTGFRYAIAAKDYAGLQVTEAADWTGTSPEVVAKLIEASEAEAWWLTNDKTPTDATVLDGDNGIMEGKEGSEYPVTFSVSESPTVQTTVTYQLQGNAPVIIFDKPDGYPLVYPFEPGSTDNLSRDEIMAKMTVWDLEDGDLIDETAYKVNGTPNGTIPKGVVGVYSVEYSVTDSDGNTATDTRAIVIDDGRYVIDRDEEIIIGAKNFVIQQKEVNGSMGQVSTYSRAEAYDIEGKALPTWTTGDKPKEGDLYISNFPPTGKGVGLDPADPDVTMPALYPAPYKANAEIDDYPFVWMVEGKTTQKEITGTVVDVDHLFPGGDNDSYSMTANDFTRNVEQAKMMMLDLNNELIKASDVKVYKLVDSADDALPYVIDNGDFQPVEDKYPLVFGAWNTVTDKRVDTSPATEVKPTGTVAQGSMPELSVTTPLEVWIGDPADKPATAILPADYKDLYQVSATDEEDGDFDPEDIVVTYLDPADGPGAHLDTPGLYTLEYTVTDSDNNSDTKKRVVVVNEGSYEVSENKDGGRILYARSFVTLLSDVSPNASAWIGEATSKGKVALFNGETGAPIGLTGNVTVETTYKNAVGVYPIKVTAVDTPSGTLVKDITGTVVDAGTLGPDDPAPFGPVNYVWGTSTTQRPGEAKDTAEGGYEAVVEVLAAAAAKTWPNKSTEELKAMILPEGDLDGYLGTFTGPNALDGRGVFHFEVWDEEKETMILLTIGVGEGEFPEIYFEERPINIPWDPESTAMVSRDQMMKGVTAWDKEDGDLTNKIVINPDADGNEQLPQIPLSEASVTQITYSVTDSDGNTTTDQCAFIVNDGSIIYDDKFILESLSFVVRSSQVVVGTATYAQIIDMSDSHAWDIKGNPATATVADDGGYTPVVQDYKVVVQVAGHTELQRAITAKVINDGTPPLMAPKDWNGENGTHQSIIAMNFRINVYEANQLVAKLGTADYANEFFQRAEVEVRDRTKEKFDPVLSATIKELVSDGGFADAANQPLKQDDVFEITFKSSGDDDAVVTIKAFVDNALSPTIFAENRVIWMGDPTNQPAGTILPSDWLASGREALYGVTANDDLDGNLTDFVKVGTGDADNFVEVKPATAQSPADLDMHDLWQPVTYQVTDSDHNTTTKTIYVMATKNATIIGDYLVVAYDFVESVDNVEKNGTSDPVILDLAAAKAWNMKNPDAEGKPTPADSVLTVVDNGGYKAEPNDYPIKIGVVPEPGYVGGDNTRDIIGKVVPKDEIDSAFDPDEPDVRYTVGANNVWLTLDEAKALTGLSDEVKQGLIDRALAEAWVADEGISAWDVDVTDNAIGRDGPVEVNTGYEVTFIPKGHPEASVTVTFWTNEGNPPWIEFQQRPLVLQKTSEPKPVTFEDLASYMTVGDLEDDAAGLDLWPSVTVVVANGITLDQRNVGVWQAEYSVTDSDGNTTTASRAIVIDDGRYIIDEDEDIIIGARDYVVKRYGTGSVDGTEGQARSLSYAEAFDIDGNPLDVTWTGAPAGYVANAEVGKYPITWVVEDRPSVPKTITAHVTEADALDPGEKSSSYAIIASNFRANLEEAADIVKNDPASYVEWAKAEVIPLVPQAGPAVPWLTDRANFKAELGEYKPITFKVLADDDPANTQSIGITGTVSQGAPPVLEVSTPLEVWIGSDPNDPRRAANSVLPDKYSDLYDVKAYDEEDGDLIDAVVVTPDAETGPVVLDEPGLYKLHYSLTDSDNNTVTADRVVVVNDGRYDVGDGRILYADSFVTRVKDVTTDAGKINEEIIGKSKARLYDGETGDPISTTAINVGDNGGYKAAPGVYDIKVIAPDEPSGTLTRAIQGEVVDADEIGSGPNEEGKDNYYVFGNNIDLRISEAQVILDAPDPEAALLEALGAGARKTLPEGTIMTLTPVVQDDGGFAAVPGTYQVTLTDPEGNASVTLEVRVGDGNMPWVKAEPKPLNYTWEPDNPTNLSRDQIMKDVEAGDLDDGDITGWVVINPDANGNEVLPAIPMNAASVTPITYKVTDSDGNSATDTRALIVNDGSISYDDKYILQGKSFVVESKDVVGKDIPQLILDYSEAQAWETNGKPATAYVYDTVSMSAQPGDYHPVLGIVEYADLKRPITAKVLDDEKGTHGGNGDTYSITANDFRINLADARALQQAAGDDYDGEFLTRADTQSYLRADQGLAFGGTPALADDSGFKTAVFAEEDDPNYPTVIPVKFWVDEDHTAFVWVDVTVSNGEHPWLKVPPLKAVPLDAPFGPADYMEGVSAGDSEDGDLTDKVTYTETVDTSVEGIYEVEYSVIDSEGNETTAIGYVLVGPWAIDGDYGVSAWDFVTTVNDLESPDETTDELIKSRSHARAVHVLRDDDGNVTGIEEVEPAVKDDAGLIPEVGEYAPIKIGVVDPEGIDDPIIEITAKVVDQDNISNTPDDDGEVNDVNTGDPDDNNRYTVAANDVTITWTEAGDLLGLDDDVKQALIEKAAAEGFIVAPEGGIEGWPVDVVLNGIEQKPGSYPVVFVPKDTEGIEVPVTFTVVWSDPPTIFHDGPLVVDQTPDPALLGNEDLLEGVTVIDPKNPDLDIYKDVDVTDDEGDFPTIDTSKVGVYPVTYTYADPVMTNDDGTPLEVSVDRAVIVDDGRFIVDPENEVIIGAKDFVVSTKDNTWTGSAADALRLSFAEAYDFEGTPLEVELVGPVPTGFANRELGVYEFTFRAVGHDEPLKTVTGEVVDADVVEPGPDPYQSKYTLIAWDFTMDVEDAAKIDLPEGLIDAAKARVVKTVPTAPDASPVVVDDGGFAPEKGVFPITFGVSDQSVEDYSAEVEATVTDGSEPILSVRTPYEIEPGTPWDRPTAMVDVTAIDPGDGDITDDVIYYPTDPNKPVDTDKPGIYPVTYEVTDSDGNTVTAPRAVVVNDGRYVVGEGRILEAQSFVIKVTDVPSTSSAIPAHLIGMHQAKLYDGETGAELPTSLISIADDGGYTRTVATYDVVVAAPDAPSGTLTKPVKAKVVGADVLDKEPIDPEDPNGSKVYTYGNDIVLRISEAAAIIGARPMADGLSLLEADRLTSDDALIEALEAGAVATDIKTNALSSKAVHITNDGGFTAAPGLYMVDVADVDDICEITLKVQVIVGNPPVITPERPIVVPVSSNPGDLTNDQKKGKSTAYDPEDGDLTDQILAEGDVPGDVPGIYQVGLRVVDSDGNEDYVLVAVVVDDGSFVFGENYIIGAYDFTLPEVDVDTTNLSGQIMEKSRVTAAKNDGTPADVMVTDLAGYTNVGGQYHPVLAVVAEPTTNKTITATVIAPAAEEYDRFAVNFDPNGGTLTGPAVIYVQEPATTLSYLPSSPVREGYTFLHWATTPEGGTEFTRSTTVVADMTVYAQWEKVPEPKQPEPMPEAPKAAPKTGDTTNPWIWVLLVAASGVALGVLAYRRKKD
ncbi:MAG: DUF5011 domain-containing protein [Eggerthellaceae bacterium]|nr:DUF5011 domain-containing protein [Eggerthellaceae bacterium]